MLRQSICKQYKINVIITEREINMIIVIPLFTLALCVAFWARCDNILAKRNIIFSAIRDYHVELGAMPHEVNYVDVERFSKTFLRIWDWRYEYILPQEKYEIIKPYIERK